MRRTVLKSNSEPPAHLDFQTVPDFSFFIQCCSWQNVSELQAAHRQEAARLRDWEMVRPSLRVDLCVNVVNGVQDKAGLAAEQLVLSLRRIHCHQGFHLGLWQDPLEMLLQAPTVMADQHGKALLGTAGFDWAGPSFPWHCRRDWATEHGVSLKSMQRSQDACAKVNLLFAACPEQGRRSTDTILCKKWLLLMQGALPCRGQLRCQHTAENALQLQIWKCSLIPESKSHLRPSQMVPEGEGNNCNAWLVRLRLHGILTSRQRAFGVPTSSRVATACRLSDDSDTCQTRHIFHYSTDLRHTLHSMLKASWAFMHWVHLIKVNEPQLSDS